MTNEPAPSPADPASDEAAAMAILDIARTLGPSRTLSPIDAAQRFAPGEGWQRALPLIRRTAVRLALEGRLVIYRKGKPIDPQELRGVYRLGLPRDE